MEKTAFFSRLVDYIRHLTDPVEIILFGSYASGMQQSHSDIDLLIIAENLHKRHLLSKEIKDFIAGFGVKADVILLTKSEVKSDVKSVSGFLANALKRSKKIYEKTS